MLYFLAVTPLSLVQVGAAISIASAGVAARPARCSAHSSTASAPSGSCWPATRCRRRASWPTWSPSSFAAVLLWTIVVTVGRTAFWGCLRQHRRRDLAAGGARALVRLPAVRCATSASRWVALASGLALAIGYRPGVPAPSWRQRRAVRRRVLAAARRAGHGAGEPAVAPGSWRTVLADRPYRLLVVAQIGYSMLDDDPDLRAAGLRRDRRSGCPGWVTGVVFTVNCLMIGLGQGLVVNAMTGRVRFRVLLLPQVASPRRSWCSSVRAGWLRRWRRVLVVARQRRLHARRAHRRPGARRARRPRPRPSTCAGATCR